MRLWAAVCLLLPAALASASEVRIPAPGATHVEAAAVTRLGNWEVTVTFDPALCEISCVYRLRADRLGRVPVADLLLPPAIDIRVFSDGAAGPRTAVVDPARTRDPRAASDRPPQIDTSALPAADRPGKPALPSAPIRVQPAAHVRRTQSAVHIAPTPLRV